jgi:hypothetical protein
VIRPSFLLACLAAVAIAEETPAPAAVTPAADGSATIARETATPPATSGPASATASPANAASGPARSAVGGRLVLAGGYDSNALLLDDTNPVVSDLDGAALSAGGMLSWRPLRGNDTIATIAASAEHDSHPDQDEGDQLRAGVLGTYARRLGRWLPGATLGAHRYWLDGEAAATAVAASLSANRPSSGWAALPALEYTHVDYDDLANVSGDLIALHYRHWLLPVPGDAKRRLEAGLRIGAYAADADFESYTTVKPTLGVRWHLGPSRAAGGWDLAASAAYENRTYAEPVPGTGDEEVDHFLSLGGEADRWLTAWLAVGAYARAANRASNYLGRDYDRVQVGLRLTAAF